ncbi:LysR family transcriptional regulator [Paraburkholderia sp. BCC1886]|uniref:LysR family transcriptional regulator n=1 Tax=Paraburkholderia sp. BCC1886 TaxID=2562670 RepID=UPI00118388EA|nr:LysR family transcriptional regulator [Paraburkholderia sp. BCC1886]
MNNINWDDLRYILAMRRETTLKAAARVLKVSHATVTRRLSDIEERLSVKLFERSGAGYVATSAADEICDVAKAMEVQVIGLERRLSGRELHLTGSVRVTTTDTLLAGGMAECLASFRQAYPDIKLEVMVSNTFFNLSRRECDIAIRPSSEPPPQLIGRCLGKLSSAIYGHRDYLAANPYAMEWNQYDWIAPGDDLQHLAQAQWIREHVDKSRVGMQVDSLLAMTQLVERRAGVAPLLCMLADRQPELQRVTDPLDEMSTEVWMLTHQELRATPRIRVLMEHVSRFASANKAFGRAVGQT